MNIQMASAGEYIDGVDSGVVADVFIRYAITHTSQLNLFYHSLFSLVDLIFRGNNVLWIADDKKNVEKPPTDDGR